MDYRNQRPAGKHILFHSLVNRAIEYLTMLGNVRHCSVMVADFDIPIRTADVLLNNSGIKFFHLRGSHINISYRIFKSCHQ